MRRVSIRQAGSGRSGRGGEGGGAGRSAWVSGGDAHIPGPYRLPACPAPRDPLLTFREPQTPHRGLALGAAGTGARRYRSTGLVNRSSCT